MRILLVEDDILIGNGLCTSMKQTGYDVEWLKDGQSAYTAIINNDERFDLIILDLGLPQLNGMQVLEKVRNHGVTIPVLILTAEDTLESKIGGLDHGADDYLTKPFDLQELYARMRALFRRGDSRTDNNITYKDIIVDPTAHTITKNGSLVNLSRREFSLLHKLLDNPGRVLSREHLTQYIYGFLEDYDSNVLEVHIHNLRKKLDADYIRTIRGVGYMIVKEEATSPEEQTTAS